MRKLLLITGLVLIVGGLAGGFWLYKTQTAHTPAPVTSAATPVTKKPSATVQPFDKTQYSLTDPASPWVVVNKQHPLLPLNYVPTDLRPARAAQRAAGQPQMDMRDITAQAIETMFAAADHDHVPLSVLSAYRSFTYQTALYNGYIARQGQTAADQESARPGYSEHQTGLAVDISLPNGVCDLEACFGTTPEGQWLAANAYRYGFILRYPADKVDITGYEYEPWHFRYVGMPLATEMHTQHIETLEEFFGVSGGAAY